MDKTGVTIHWSLLPDDLDWSNLALARATRVMTNLAVAQIIAPRLRAQGIDLVIRVPLEQSPGPKALLDQVRPLNPLYVIVGNEEDRAFNFLDGSSDFGINAAYNYRYRLSSHRTILQAGGIHVLSGALMMRSISEDEPAQPGQYSWGEVLRSEVDRAQGNCVHLYTYNILGDIDWSRVKFALKHYGGLWHRDLYIDEANIATGDQLTRMTTCVRILDMLLHHPHGRRVKMFCPFVSNGDGKGWPIGMLMRDPSCYSLLGTYMEAH